MTGTTVWPVTPLQEGLVALAEIDDPARYLGHAVVELATTGAPVDLDAVEAAVHDLLRAHTHLLAAFVVDDDVAPLQLLEPDVPVDIARHEAHGDLDRRAEAVVLSRRAQEWRLDAAPLIRLDIVTDPMTPDRALLVVVAHHVVLDGWSMPLLVACLADTLDGGRPVGDGGYADHLARLLAQDSDAARDFWAEHLAQCPRQAQPWSVTARERRKVSRVTQPLTMPTGLAENGLTPAALFRTAWGLALDAVTGGQGTPFAVAVSTRDTDADTLVGLTTETVLVSEQPRPEGTVVEAARVGAQRWARTLAHQHIGLRGIHAALGTSELATSLLAVESSPAQARWAAGELTVALREVEDDTHYPLAPTVRRTGQGWQLRLDHDERVPDATARRLASAFAALVAHAQRPVAEVCLLDDDDRFLLDAGGLPDPRGSDSPETLPASLVRIVRAVPNRVALVDASAEGRGRSWTFADLRAHVAARGAELLAVLPSDGATPVVAVVAPRSASIVLALLAVHDIGAVPLVLDPGLPPARQTAILDDLDVAVVLTGVEADEIVVRHGRPGGAAIRHTTPDDVAVLTLTSGSTGLPKPVAVPHRALAHLLAHHGDALHPDGDTSPRQVAHTASFFFDAHWDALLALYCGHTVHVLAEDLYLDPHRLAGYCASEDIAYLDLTPTVWAALLAAGAFTRLPATCVLGGEALPADLWADLRRRTEGSGSRALNLYGPSEATVDAACADLRDAETPVVGRPVAQTGLLVLDGMLRRVAPGTPGELYLVGPGVAHGYAGRPGATAERFVANPYPRVDDSGAALAHDDRMYRTGDLATWTEEGLLVVMGRTDSQLSLGGRRIDPGEVESVLLADPAVTQATVLAHPTASGRGRLVAHVVLAAERDVDELVAWCRSQLPAALVPAEVRIHPSLPLTPNGKLDVAALLSAGGSPPRRPTAASGASGPAVRAVRDALAGVLRLDPTDVGGDSDLLELGGDSITAVQAAARLRAEGWAVRAADVLHERTVERIAARATPIVEGNRVGDGPGVDVVLTSGQAQMLSEHLDAVRPGARIRRVLPLSPAQHGIYVDSQRYGRDPYVTTMTLRLENPGGRLDEDAVHAGVIGWFAGHEVLRTMVWQGDLEAPVAVVLDTATPPSDVVHVTGADFDAAVSRAQDQERSRHLDLHRGVVGGYTWVREDEHAGVLVVSLHHLVADGWSTPLLVDELARSLSGAAPEELDDSGWRSYLQWLQGQDHAALDAVWRRELGDREPALLATGGAPGVERDEARVHIDARQAAGLRAALLGRGVTLATACGAAWAYVVGAATGRVDVAYLLAAAGRPEEVPGIDRAVGMFVTTRPVVVQTDLPVQDVLREHAVAVARTQTAAHRGLGQIARLVGHQADSLLVVESYPRSSQAPTGPRVLPLEGSDATTFPVAATVLLGGGPGGRAEEEGMALEVEVDPARCPLPSDVLAQAWRQALLDLAAGTAPRPDVPRVPAGPARSTASQGVHAMPSGRPDGVSDAVVRAVAEVLGTDRATPQDSFFELGGDSIAAVRLVGALRGVGLQVGVTDVFSAPSLAAVAAACHRLPDPTATSRDVLLTPALGWYADLACRAGAAARGFVQLRQITLPAGTSVDRVGAAVRELVARHDALRLMTAPLGIASAHSVAPVVVSHTDLVTSLQRLGAELDPDGGDLVRAVVVVDDDATRVVLLIHHIGVDAVSWGLLEDELRRLVDGQDLPPAPSFAEWTHHQMSAVPRVLDSLPWWQERLAVAPPIVQGAKTAGTVGQAAEIEVTVDAGPLLTASAAGWRIEALLAAALVWHREEDLVIEMEGHGRPTGLPDDDPRALSTAAGAVGWFTATWPVRLPGSPGREGRSVRDRLVEIAVTVEQARARGGDYGMLRHLDDTAGPALAEAERRCPPQVLVNYLGAAGDAAGGDGMDAATLEGRLGLAHGLPVSHPVEINAHLDSGGSLVARWQLAAPMADRAGEHVESWCGALAEILAADIGAAPSRTHDAVGLAGRELAALAADGVQAVWPMTPVQQGMVFHALGEDPYVSVLDLALMGPLDAEVLRDAFAGLLASHPQLRARVRWVGLGGTRRPVLVTVPPGDGAWTQVTVTTERLDEAAAEQVRTALAHQYDLEGEPLLRAVLIRCDDRARLVVANHHILLDGWSMPLLVDELLRRYAAGPGTAVPGDPARSDFARHVLRRRNAQAFDDALERRASLLATAQVRPVVERAPGGGTAAVERTMDPAVLTGAARRLATTVGVVVELVWGAVLAALSGAEESLTATVVSGRDGSDADATLLGMLTDTVPLLARFGSGSVEDCARSLAAQTASVVAEPVVGLAALSRSLGRSVDLDTLLVVESYPHVDLTEGARAAGLAVEVVDAEDATHYPLSLTVETGAGGDAAQLRLEHDTALMGGTAAAAVVDTLVSLVTALAGEIDPNDDAADLLALARQTVVRITGDDLRKPTAVMATAPLEDMIAAYAQALDLPATALHAQSNFFSLGGDSITAMTVVAACRERGLVVRPTDVLAAPTPQELATRAVRDVPGLTPTPSRQPEAPLLTLDASGSAALHDLLRSIQ